MKKIKVADTILSPKVKYSDEAKKKLKFNGSVLIKEKPCFRYKIFSRKLTHSGCGMAFDGDGS